MIKLVASDLDGTLLLNGAQKLPEEVFPLIRELKKEGILFVAASGRQYANMKRLFEPVLEDMAFICENGALAFWNDELLYEAAFEENLAREITETLYAKEGSEFSYSTRDFYYMMPKTEHYRSLMIDVVKNHCKIVKSFEEMKEPCVKIAVYERGGVTEESIRFWREKFGDRCTVVTSGFDWVDFIPFGTNKARGIRKFQEILNAAPGECVGFGDEYNDIEMLKSVTYGFAMSHAKPGVKTVAAYEAPAVLPVLRKIIDTRGKIEEVF